MKAHASAFTAISVGGLFFALGTMSPGAVCADEGYLAIGGNNGTVDLLRLTDFTKVASIDVSPITYPWLRFLPLRRRLYAYEFDLVDSNLNTVLDFSTCSGALLQPLQIPAPSFVGANSTETNVLIGSTPDGFLGQTGINRVYVVDPASDVVTGTLAETGSHSYYPDSFFADPDRNELYVGWESGNLLVYDPQLTYLRRCSALADERYSVVANGKIYAAGGNRFEVYDAVTCVHTGTILLPGQSNTTVPVRTRAGDKVYVVMYMSQDNIGNPTFLSTNRLAVIDTATDQAVTFPLGRELTFQTTMVLSADETRAYIAMEGVGDAPNAVGVFDLQAGTLQQYLIDVVPTDQRGLALIDRLGFQCGDSVVESACGEQCDPPGSVVNGTICDSNCTMGCGNGIVSGTEQCDDGNTNNSDGCKNDCTLNVCGDGVVYRGVEQCDHGALNGTDGDACDADCHLPPRTAGGQVNAGGTLTTDVEGNGATASAPVETSVTSPVAGAVSIEEGAPDPTSPSGYAFLGYSVHVTVPSSTPDNPIILVFEIHSALLPEGSNQTALEFSKNGVLVADCDAGGSTGSPDPCVASRALLGNGNLQVTIRSSTASYWGGVAPWHDARLLARRPLTLRIPANKLFVTKKILIRVRNMDRPAAGQKRTTRIQLTATSVDCPPGLIADVPDFDARKPFSQDTVSLTPRRTAAARLRLVASRFAFPKEASPRVCTIRLRGDALVVDNVDPTPGDNTITVPITVTTR